MHPTQKNTVAILVATAHRTRLLQHRALPSIEHQSLPPSRVTIVDDSGENDAAKRTERLVRAWQPAGMDVDFLRNRRTRGASGAWNSGLDHLLRTCGDPARLYVAILDDDDWWDSHHLRGCLTVAEDRDLDMVAARFWRIEGNAEPLLVVPPPSLDMASFLVGNPGIQGSNLVCRLSVLLEAGLFDESLPSCTDRDLCIRIAELPGVRYGTTAEPTVRHFACESRSRLSTPGSPAKIKGLNGFFRKYQGRMSDAEREAFRTRAERLFGWIERPPKPAINDGAQGGSVPSISRTAAPPQAPPHLIVGLIADTARLEEVSNLLLDLRELSGAPGLSGHDVLILENGEDQAPSGELRTLVEHQRNDGLRIYFVDRARHLEHAVSGLVGDGGVSRGCKLAIAGARTVLQSYLYGFAKERPGAVVWIVDEDMRLDPLVVEEDGHMHRRAQKIAPILRELRRLHAGGKIDIALGTQTGAPPVPFAATVRVQLVDLVSSLWWLASQEPAAALPDRALENAGLRFRRRDYYYDLSRKETDRLETPFWITPGGPGERVGEAFHRIAGAAERILAGEQVFRPLAIEASLNPLESIGDGLQRGGNTLVFDIESLRLAPNPSPVIDGRPSRRADMVWALLQERYFGRQVVTLPFALHHDRSHVTASALDVAYIVDDIRGYAMFSALEATPGVFKLAADDRGIRLSEEMVECFGQRVQKFLEERLAAFRLSFYRIRGLTCVLRRLVDDTEKWWQEDEYQAAAKQLQTFSDHLADCYDTETLYRIEREAKALNARRIREFLEQLPVGIESHRDRLSHSVALVHAFEDDRIANAKAVAGRLAAPTAPLTVLGQGSEGVSLSDGQYVYKVFDYWKSRNFTSTRDFLQKLVGAWKDAHCLYPLLEFHVSGNCPVLVYPFEPSEPYTGGYGPGMVELLAECRRYGVICRNIHPKNLRVVNGRVRLIDYGSDIHPWDEREFVTMCQRAWLSYRWANRPNLKEIMRVALEDERIPELDGFARFYEAVQRVTGQYTVPEDVALGLAEPACRVLDYGCGNGQLARDLANQSLQVLGYDLDRSRRPRWDSLCRERDNLQFTHQRSDIMAAGPFDLVVCRRVLCTIEDDAELGAVLRDLRSLVTDSGRVIVTLCNPHFTFGGPTPEADRELPADARYESTFVYRKRIRASGRIRRDVHRPERVLLREFARAGLAVRRRVEIPTVDLERFEPASDHLAFELGPMAPLTGDITLMIKACAMEAETLDVQVRHLVSQLEGPRAFAERMLALDSREDGFLRQHTEGNLRGLHDAADRLVEAGWIDRVVEGPGDGNATAALNQKWFGVSCPCAHSATGVQVAPTLAGFEACATRYVLQLDVDAMVGRLDRDHDYLAEMLAVLAGDPEAITVSFNIAMEHGRPYAASGEPARGARRCVPR